MNVTFAIKTFQSKMMSLIISIHERKIPLKYNVCNHNFQTKIQIIASESSILTIQERCRCLEFRVQNDFKQKQLLQVYKIFRKFDLNGAISQKSMLHFHPLPLPTYAAHAIMQVLQYYRLWYQPSAEGLWPNSAEGLLFPRPIIRLQPKVKEASSVIAWVLER